MAEGMWELWDGAASLDSAAAAWTRLSTALGDAGDTLVARSKGLLAADWEGDAATSYAAHRKDLVGALDEASTLASQVASTMTGMAGVVRIAQGSLNLSWATISGIEHTGSPSGEVRFQYEGDAELAKINAATTRAQEIRDGLDSSLAEDQKALGDQVAEWNALTSAWQAIADGDQDPFILPPDADGIGVISVGDQTFVNTGGGDDNVRIAIDPVTGDQIVTVNGETYRVPAGQHIVIRTGEGQDVVEVPKGTDVDVTILGGKDYDRIQGGAGDDRVLGGSGDDEVDAGDGDDVVLAGGGRDYVDGQRGDDLLSGGGGDDTVYGLDGDDSLLGGGGQDYLEGGQGDDRILGGAGKDVVSGGRDDDRLYGGGDADRVYAGAGTDTTSGGSGEDHVHAESGDTEGDDVEHTVTVQISDTARFIKIEGSPEFVARVEADLDMLRSSPNGQQMLEALQHKHENSGGWFGIGREDLTIREYPDNTNSTADPDNNDIDYSTRIDHVDGAPPVAVLFHEMAHVYDFMYGNYDDTPYDGEASEDKGVEQGERTAVGLPVDHDHDDSTEEIRDPDHPYALTENGLREEMGVELREDY